MNRQPYYGNLLRYRLAGTTPGTTCTGGDYLIGFIVVLNQFKPLLGERGLLPVPAFLNRVRFWGAPSIFHWNYSDRVLDAVARCGILLSGIALLGISEAGPVWISAATWLCLWVLYLSIWYFHRLP